MSVAESYDHIYQTLPEFSGDLSHWNDDVSKLREALRHPGGYEFQAQLPEVVGHLTEQERILFDQLEYNDTFGADAAQSILAKLLPDSLGVITSDMATVSGDTARIKYLELENLLTSEGHPFKVSGWHTDGGLQFQDEALLPYYVICGSSPVLCYRGPAKFYFRGNHLVLDEESLSAEEGDVVPAAAYDILRLSLATVHSAQSVAEADGSRPFLRTVPALK